jgi:PAS domain S-box-containing protein
MRELPDRRQPEASVRFERDFLSGILETTGAVLVVLDSGGRILRLNRAIEVLSGATILDTVGQPFWEAFLHEGDDVEIRTLFGDTHPGRFPFECQCRLRTLRADPAWVYWTFTAIAAEDDPASVDYVVATGADITALKRAEQEKEALIAQLRDALARVKTLRGLVPICASCKRIRDDQGYWRLVEEYVRDHSEAEFSHGICPACMRKLYPEYCGPDGV